MSDLLLVPPVNASSEWVASLAGVVAAVCGAPTTSTPGIRMPWLVRTTS